MATKRYDTTTIRERDFDGGELRGVRDLLDGQQVDPRRFVVPFEVELDGGSALLTVQVEAPAPARGEEFIRDGRIGFRVTPARVVDRSSVESADGVVTLTVFEVEGRGQQVIVDPPPPTRPAAEPSPIRPSTWSASTRWASLVRSLPLVGDVVGRVVNRGSAPVTRKFAVEVELRADGAWFIEWFVDPSVSATDSDSWKGPGTLKIKVTTPKGRISAPTGLITDSGRFEPIGTKTATISRSSKSASKVVYYDVLSGMIET